MTKFIESREEVHVDPLRPLRQHFPAPLRNAEITSSGRFHEESLGEVEFSPMNAVPEHGLLARGLKFSTFRIG